MISGHYLAERADAGTHDAGTHDDPWSGCRIGNRLSW